MLLLLFWPLLLLLLLSLDLLLMGKSRVSRAAGARASLLNRNFDMEMDLALLREAERDVGTAEPAAMSSSGLSFGDIWSRYVFAISPFPKSTNGISGEFLSGELAIV